MANIGLLVRDNREEIVKLSKELSTWASSNQHKILYEANTAKLLKQNENSLSADELAKQSELIITLGGDGTLISIARHAAESKTAILGVNFGNLGFLTEITPNELISTLDDLMLGKVDYAERSMLQVDVVRKSKSIFSTQAINDVVVQKGSRNSLINLDLISDGEDVMRIRADGIIFSTPTGSTAYSLAAGGSIVHPFVSAILVTPICPHSLTNRPLMLPDSSKLVLRIPEYSGEVFVSVDGQQSNPLKTGDEVVLKQSESKLKFVHSLTRGYFEILRTKLNWGLGYRKEH